MYQRFRQTLLASLAAGLLGCGSDLPKPQSVDPAPPPTLKQLLTEVTESGAVESGGAEIEAEIEKLKSTNEAKAKQLSEDFKKLQTLPDEEAVKALAKKMVETL